MKSILKSISLFLLAIIVSCTVAGNQSCNSDNLITYATQGEQSKIDACYKSGAQILISSKGKSIRQIALNNGHKELGNYFIDVQTEKYKKNNAPLDTSTLWSAIEYDNVEIVQHFVDKGIDINPKFRDGLTPMVYAIFNDSNAIIEFLLKQGIDVGYEFDSRPLICMTAMFNQLETTKTLFKYGADVNDLDGSGVTPLMFAARGENVEMVKFLLEKGADKTLREIRYQTAADMVKNNKELKEMLEF